MLKAPVQKGLFCVVGNFKKNTGALCPAAAACSKKYNFVPLAFYKTGGPSR